MQATTPYYPTASVAVGDVDGDGDLDLMADGFLYDPYISWTFPEPSRLYLNDGTGNFVQAPSTRIGTGGATAALALGDVDGDGDLDLVQGNIYGVNAGPEQNRLYLNLQRQLHAPTAPQIGQPYTLDAYLRYGPSSPITFALPYVSLAPASIPLPPFGTVGIDPAQAFALPAIVIPQPAGVGSLAIPVPNDPGLIGTPVYSQALLVPYPHPARLSSVVNDMLQ